MKKIITYTFRTYPHIQDLSEVFPQIFILDKLKSDLQSLCKLVKQESPDLILGIAHSKNSSTFEQYTVNKFHGGKKVCSSFHNRLDLFTPQMLFDVRKTPTTSFCNYSMFTIANFLKEECQESKLSFVHLKKTDIPMLSKLSSPPLSKGRI